MQKLLATAVVLISTITLFSFKAIEPTTWTLDPAHSNLRFSITHLGINDVEGTFTKFDAKITVSKEDWSDAQLTMTAEANSINTGNEKRDGHLKTADFLETDKYPSITFKSTSFKKVGDKNYLITGDLTAHGVTKSITIDGYGRSGMNPMSNKAEMGFKFSGKIKRSDFGIGAKMPEAMLSDEIMVVANGEYVKN